MSERERIYPVLLFFVSGTLETASHVINRCGYFRRGESGFGGRRVRRRSEQNRERLREREARERASESG